MELAEIPLKKTVRKDWVSVDQAAEIIGVSVENIVGQIRRKEIVGKIRRGRLYVTRQFVEESIGKRNADPEKLSYVISGGRLFTPSLSKSQRRKILINTTFLSPGRFAYEVKDVADAFRREVSVIESIIKKNNLKVVEIGDKRYIDRWSFWNFLEKNQKGPDSSFYLYDVAV